MAIAEAAAVVTTLKSASELVDRLRKSEDRNTLRAGIDALTEMLINARMSALDLIQEKEALLDRVNVLERQADIAVEFGDKSEKYQRVQMPAGMFVYSERRAQPGNAQPLDFVS